MTSELLPGATRRELRAHPEAPGRRIALAWLDEDSVTARPAPRELTADGPSFTPAAADLLGRAPRRPVLRAATVVPPLSVLALAGAYAAATLLWPLNAVAPRVTPAEVAELSAPATAVTWPEAGSAAISVAGGAVAASDDVAVPLASITKLVTVQMALEEAPLEAGQPGPDFAFTWSDRATFWQYLARDESALDVPVGASLSEYQLLQGILMASAGNYTQRLVSEYWPSDEAFATAAHSWLEAQGLTGITVVEPTGIDPANTGTPEAVIALAEKAMANPVLAEIVGTARAELPGVGEIVNTNELVGQDGIVGVKTGSLRGGYNLVVAQDGAIANSALRTYAVVLGQPRDAVRFSEAERLLSAVATEASVPHTVPAGTVVGEVTTLWGSEASVITDEDASVTLWNGARATVTAELSLADAERAESRRKGAEAGTVTLAGPLGEAAVSASLDAGIDDPDAWWRLTHPLQLWGLAG